MRVQKHNGVEASLAVGVLLLALLVPRTLHGTVIPSQHALVLVETGVSPPWVANGAQILLARLVRVLLCGIVMKNRAARVQAENGARAVPLDMGGAQIRALFAMLQTFGIVMRNRLALVLVETGVGPGALLMPVRLAVLQIHGIAVMKQHANLLAGTGAAQIVLAGLALFVQRLLLGIALQVQNVRKQAIIGALTAMDTLGAVPRPALCAVLLLRETAPILRSALGLALSGVTAAMERAGAALVVQCAQMLTRRTV